MKSRNRTTHSFPDAGKPFSFVATLADGQALSGAHDVELAGDLAFVAGKGGSIATVDVRTPGPHHRAAHARSSHEMDARDFAPGRVKAERESHAGELERTT